MKISIEGELVGSHDRLSVVLWSKYYIKAQYYIVEHKNLYQDNNSATLMENNGRDSISNTIEYCPTENVWADALDNPKRGKVLGSSEDS